MMKIPIRRAQLKDAEALPEIENSAGQVFLQIPDLAWLVEGEDIPVEWHRRVISQGNSWVAVNAQDHPVAFLSAEIISRELHILELSVHHEYQRAGLGRRMLQQSIDDAKFQNLEAVTLTTFRNVPWNGPFYATVGFVELQSEEIGPRLNLILQAEAARGWPDRCAMRLKIR